MDEIRTKLEAELRQAVRRLRQMGGAVAAEDLPGAIGDNSPFADEVDEIQANESRELGFATRTLLVERVNRLADALERLNEGEYGVCVECSEPIPPARLRALPEVQTCVRCQDRLERIERRMEPVGAGVGETTEEEAQANRGGGRTTSRPPGIIPRPPHPIRESIRAGSFPVQV